MDRKVAIKSMIFLVLTLVILITPQVHSLFINQTFNKSLYPSGSYIITTYPMATFPQDHKYCYIGQNEFNVEMVFHNVEQKEYLTQFIDSELARADIHITWTFTDFKDDTSVYFDFEFEAIMSEYRRESQSHYIIAISDMVTPTDSGYYNLAGYARVQSRFAIVFTQHLPRDLDVSAIALHEITHLLGYWHSEYPECVMYPQYTTMNTKFVQSTVDVLYQLHH